MVHNCLFGFRMAYHINDVIRSNDYWGRALQPLHHAVTNCAQCSECKLQWVAPSITKVASIAHVLRKEKQMGQLQLRPLMATMEEAWQGQGP